jgi:hypothetical protein
MEENYPQDIRDIYLSNWQDSVDAINNADASETEIIQANKDHLAMLISFTWFTDAITADELATINAVLA